MRALRGERVTALALLIGTFLVARCSGLLQSASARQVASGSGPTNRALVSTRSTPEPPVGP